MSRTVEKITGRIVGVERLNNSVNGNPRFRVDIEGHGWYMTSSDASVSYSIENFRRTGDVIEWTLTHAGRVAYGERIDPVNC